MIAYKSGRSWLQRLPSDMPVFWGLRICSHRCAPKCLIMSEQNFQSKTVRAKLQNCQCILSEQNWHRYLNTFFQPTLMPYKNRIFFMFIFLTLTSASYVHQNEICIALLCIRLFASCITDGLAAKPLGFWANYLWYLRSRWSSFHIVISHRCRCSSYHKRNTTLLHKLSHCNWLCKHLILFDCISSKREQQNNGGVLELITSGCICWD